jgi:hypothetical protein
VWHDQINDTDAAALCAAWRAKGITSSHDHRALLTAEARRRRWWLTVRSRWQRAAGRRAVA